MPVVNREIVLPVPRERAWELITEPSELEEWLGPMRITPRFPTPLQKALATESTPAQGA